MQDTEALVMGATSVDHTLPGDKWVFDEGVTSVFDDMLRRSIPDYDKMRDLCAALACRYRVEKTDIVDLGCSRGEAIAPLIQAYGATNHFVGVEVAPPMLEAVRQRFKGYIDCGVLDVRDIDLRHAYPPVLASVTLCVLTLQFTPIEYRQQILSRVYQHTRPGGAFILVEKVLGASAEIDTALVEAYLDLKRLNGYSEEEIQRKKMSLEGVLVPVTAKWNEELLRTAGFTQVDCFWRWMNFAGWVAVK